MKIINHLEASEKIQELHFIDFVIAQKKLNKFYSQSFNIGLITKYFVEFKKIREDGKPVFISPDAKLLFAHEEDAQREYRINGTEGIYLHTYFFPKNLDKFITDCIGFELDLTFNEKALKESGLCNLV